MNIKLSKLLDICHPVKDGAWGTGVIPAWMIHKRVRKQNTYDHETWARIATHHDYNILPWLHAGRIAYFVLNGWTDPISLEIGVPGMFEPEWIIDDGNHRTAAAWFMNKEYIDVDFSGDVDLFNDLFLT